MSCPDDDTYAQLLQGMLSSNRVAELEHHLDTCAACTNLVAQLGKIYGAAGPDPSTLPSDPLAPNPVAPNPVAPMEPVPRGPSRLLELEIGMTVSHLVWALLSLSVLWRALSLSSAPPGAAVIHEGTALAAALGWYVAAWAPLGAVLAVGCVIGLTRQQRWARVLAGAHAVLSLPSLILLPLAVLVLRELLYLARAGEQPKVAERLVRL